MFNFTPLTEVALYIHIPFCRSKCFYCDFYSEIPPDSETVQRVISETISQGQYFLEQLGEPVIKSVYLGGGTPSSLPPVELTRLLDFIRNLKKIPDDFEFTIEANPESLHACFLHLCRDYGVNRLSVGIQSCQADQLKLLGRLTTPAINRKALELLQGDWAGRLNLDLIAGLPRQTRETIREDLRLVLGNRPGHISLYSLTIENGTALQQQIERGELQLEPEDVRDDLWFTAAELLREAGFTDYEISNFSLPGEECRHNLTYWELNPYLGLGAGAVSTLPVTVSGSTACTGGNNSAEKKFHPDDLKIVRLQNPCLLAPFLSGGEKKWGNTSETISLTDFFIENLMMGFRLKNGISKAQFRKRFRMDLPHILQGLWPLWKSRGYLPKETDEQAATYRLTTRGRLFLNTLIEDVIGIKQELSQTLTTTGLQWP